MIEVWLILLIMLLGPVIGWLGMYIYEKNQEIILPYWIAIKFFFTRDSTKKK